MFKDFRFIVLEVSLKCLEKATLNSYHGSMIRGVIGQTLRKVSCTKGKSTDCGQCSSFKSCPYANVFYSIDKSSEDMLTKVTTIPNPFVVYPLMKGKEKFEEGESLKFNLTLFGKAISYLHYFIHALNEIKERGLGSGRKKFELEYIKDIKTGEMILIGDELSCKDIRGYKLDIEPLNVKRITLEFDTPLRIKHEGKPAGTIDFEIAMKNILRRIAMAHEYFMDKKIDIDYKKLIDESSGIKTVKTNIRWKKLTRFSSRAKRKLSIGGMSGKISFSGNLTKFYPYIKAGEILHIGSGCTLGLGHYNIIFE